jgi:hypothetical protein
MEIEDKGNLDAYEPMPIDTFLYITAVQFEGGYWTGGPSGTDKNMVIQQLQSYSGVELARIYKVKVPVKSIPAA